MSRSKDPSEEVALRMEASLLSSRGLTGGADHPFHFGRVPKGQTQVGAAPAQEQYQLLGAIKGQSRVKGPQLREHGGKEMIALGIPVRHSKRIWGISLVQVARQHRYWFSQASGNLPHSRRRRAVARAPIWTWTIRARPGLSRGS